ncbi:MAG: hypothetical protein HFI76_13155 [Lachnospiraceae bacterium]|jgi:hypothetical protein|nr:hypothetical protein [Lachnospiraceae bacterium]
MKLELSQRDILLLKLTVCILIVFVVLRFVVVPGIGDFREKLDTGRELEEKKEEIQDALAGVPALQQTAEGYKAKLKEASASYYERMENRQVDELLTGLALKLGLFPVSLAIQEAEPGIPGPYLSEILPENGSLEPYQGRYLLTGVGNFTLRGTQAQIFSFLDEIEENHPAIRIRSMKIGRRVYLDSEWDMGLELEASFELEIYMCDWSEAE